MLQNHILLSVLWTVYCVLHSLMADLRMKRFFQKRLGAAFRHYRLAYTLFAFVGLFTVVLFQVSITSQQLFTQTIFSNVAGAIVSSAGLLLMFVCIKKYFMNLSGLRSLVEEESLPVLVVSGVHRFVRHPLYLGTFAFIWGLLLLFPTISLLLSNTIITVYTLVGIKLEERKLVMEFGEDYRTYQGRVPKLVPRFRLDQALPGPRRQNETVGR
jgi:protein-S-isoprenylcysteine O-methyltransferase Ste14